MEQLSWLPHNIMTGVHDEIQNIHVFLCAFVLTKRATVSTCIISTILDMETYMFHIIVFPNTTNIFNYAPLAFIWPYPQVETSMSDQNLSWKLTCIVQEGNAWSIALITVDCCDVTLSNVEGRAVVGSFRPSLWCYGKHNEPPEELLTPSKKHMNVRMSYKQEMDNKVDKKKKKPK